ncbi:MAG: C-GCAxxG-C-C family protein [Anaerolineales bacterium]
MAISPLDNVVAIYRAGCHCSEAMVLGVGGLYLQPVPEVLVRASCPFGGGVCEHEELCGALSGGVMVLGALWGREAPGINDDLVKDLACQYRRRFREHFGHTLCAPIHDSPWRTTAVGCAQVVRDSAEILIDLIDTTHRQVPFAYEVSRP